MEKVDDAPAAIPPSTKAIKTWWARETSAKGKRPMLPQAAPMAIRPTRNRFAQRGAAAGSSSTARNRKIRKILKRVTTVMTESHGRRRRYGIACFMMKKTIREFTKVARMPNGARA